MPADSITTMMRDDFQEGFLEGAAASLVVNRNRHLGNLLNSERNVFYAQILYRMLAFRRNYELEPLNEDLYAAVRGAQENVSGEPYPPEVFNQDVTRLGEWGLIRRRIERGRLKSYKDTSRNKFRYRLADEAVFFLEWLEDRLRDDEEERGNDTRDLLSDVRGRLRETLSSLPSAIVGGDDGETLSAEGRAVVYNLHQLLNLTDDIVRRLGDLNARLLSFLLSDYTVDEARGIIDELNFYLNTYLIQIDQSRETIVPVIDELSSEGNLETLNQCRLLLDSERRRAPILMRTSRRPRPPGDILEGLKSFYQTAGRLDDLCRRVNDSTMRVLGKLSSHLRELERKNVRLEDLRSRIADVAALDENAVPFQFLSELIASAGLVSDPHYWDAVEKAEPPLPRRIGERVDRDRFRYVGPKKRASGTVRSLDESRLEELGDWLRRRSAGDEPISMPSGSVDSFDDCLKIVDLAKRGLFENGAKLRKIGFSLKVGGEDAAVTLGEARLTFKEMLVTVAGQAAGQ